MPDLYDHASDIEAHFRDVDIKNARASKESAKPTGYCLHCDEHVRSGIRWCDADCRDDWEHEQKRKRA